MNRSISIISELVFRKQGLIHWRGEENERENWIKDFHRECDSIKKLWVGHRERESEDDDPLATSENLAWSLLDTIADKIVDSYIFFCEQEKEIIEEIQELRFILPHDVHRESKDFLDHYHKDFLPFNDFQDGITELDDIIEERKVRWEEHVDKLILSHVINVDSALCSTVNRLQDEFYDLLVKEEMSVKEDFPGCCEKIIQEYVKEIKSLDENLWSDLYLQLRWDERLIEKVIPGNFVPNIDALIALAKDDVVWRPTEFRDISRVLADKLRVWDWDCRTNHYALYKYKYCLDYCKWRAGYITIDQYYDKMPPPVVDDKLDAEQIVHLIDYSGIRKGNQESNETWAMVLGMVAGMHPQTIRQKFSSLSGKGKSDKVKEKNKVVEKMYDDLKQKKKQK